MEARTRNLQQSQACKGVPCRAKPWEILAIVGPSGAGKSSLLEILAAGLLPQTGSVLVNQRPGYFISKHEIPGYWIFMHYISLFKYPFEGFLINEFSKSSKCLEYGFEKCLMTEEEQLKEERYGEENRWKNVVIMLCFVLLYRFISYVHYKKTAANPTAFPTDFNSVGNFRQIPDCLPTEQKFSTSVGNLSELFPTDNKTVGNRSECRTV